MLPLILALIGLTIFSQKLKASDADKPSFITAFSYIGREVHPIDYNGDGTDELLIVADCGNSGDMTLMDQNKMTKWTDHLGNNICGMVSALVVVRSSKAGVEREFIYSYRKGDSLFLRARINENTRSVLLDVRPLLKDHTHPDWSGEFIGYQPLDVNDDGIDELVGAWSTGVPTYPRGLAAYDLKNGKELWHYWLGPKVQTPCFADIDGDGRKEIIIGTYAPANGSKANETDDYHTYIMAFDRKGKLLWQSPIGGLFSGAYIKMINPDSNGNPRILCWEEKQEAGADSGDAIMIINALNGSIDNLQRYGRHFRGLEIADLDNDGKEEIIAGNSDGRIRIFSLDLKKKKERFFKNNSYVNVRGVADLDGGVKKEVVVTGADDKIMVLNHKLNVIASQGGFEIEPPVVLVKDSLRTRLLSWKTKGNNMLQYDLIDYFPKKGLSVISFAKRWWLLLFIAIIVTILFIWSKIKHKDLPFNYLPDFSRKQISYSVESRNTGKTLPFPEKDATKRVVSFDFSAAKKIIVDGKDHSMGKRGLTQEFRLLEELLNKDKGEIHSSAGFILFEGWQEKIPKDGPDRQFQNEVTGLNKVLGPEAVESFIKGNTKLWKFSDSIKIVENTIDKAKEICQEACKVDNIDRAIAKVQEALPFYPESVITNCLLIDLLYKQQDSQNIDDNLKEKLIFAVGQLRIRERKLSGAIRKIQAEGKKDDWEGSWSYVMEIAGELKEIQQRVVIAEHLLNKIKLSEEEVLCLTIAKMINEIKKVEKADPNKEACFKVLIKIPLINSCIKIAANKVVKKAIAMGLTQRSEFDNQTEVQLLASGCLYDIIRDRTIDIINMDKLKNYLIVSMRHKLFARLIEVQCNISESNQKLIRDVARIRNALYNELHREPYHEEMIGKLGPSWNIEKLDEIYTYEKQLKGLFEDIEDVLKELEDDKEDQPLENNGLLSE